MTLKDLEQTLFSLTPAETEALQALPQLKKYCALMVSESETDLREEERIFCRGFEQSGSYLSMTLDRNGYVPEKLVFEEQEGTFHVVQQPRFCAEPVHRHHFFELVIVYAGECRIYMDDQERTLETGEVCVIGVGTRHQIRPLDAGDIVVCLRIKTESLDHLGRWGNPLVTEYMIPQSREGLPDAYLILPMKGNERFWNTLRLMICEYMDHDYVSLSCFALYLTAMMLQLARGRWKEAGQPYRTEATDSGEMLEQYIQHFYRTCTLESMAKQFNFSPSYISTIIKKRTGKTFSELRRNYRLAYAANLLRSGSDPVEQVAEQCGYHNISFFYRAFRAAYNCTPQEYRQSMEII